MSASAEYFKSIAGVVPQETLGHLAAGRIAGTQKENALLT